MPFIFSEKLLHVKLAVPFTFLLRFESCVKSFFSIEIRLVFCSVLSVDFWPLVCS